MGEVVIGTVVELDGPAPRLQSSPPSGDGVNHTIATLSVLRPFPLRA